jgi:hypothetical protein
VKQRGGVAAARQLGYESSTGTGWATANSSRDSSSSSSGSSGSGSRSSSSSSEDEEESSREQGVFGDPDLSFPPHLPSAKRKLAGKAAAGAVRSPAGKGAAGAAGVAASPSKQRKVGSTCALVFIYLLLRVSRAVYQLRPSDGYVPTTEYCKHSV